MSRKPDRYYEEKLDFMREEGPGPIPRQLVSREGNSMNNTAVKLDDTPQNITAEEKKAAREEYIAIAMETQATLDIDPKEFNKRVRTRIEEVEEDTKDFLAWVRAAEWVSAYCIEDETRVINARQYQQRLKAATKPPSKPRTFVSTEATKSKRFPADKPNEANTPKVEPPQERVKVKPSINLADMYEMPEVILVGGQITKPGPVKHEHIGEESSIEEEGELRLSERVRTTRRTIQDLDGHKAATELVQKLNNDLRKICATSPFGRVCRVDREPELRAFIEDARIQAKEHRDSPLGRYHKVYVHLLPGMITQDSERAAKTLVKEMQGLFDSVQTALNECNVDAIRDTVKRVRALSNIFPESQQKVLEKAIAGARQVANTVAREVERKGRTIEDVKQELDMSPIREARMQLLALPADSDEDLKIEKPESKRFDAPTAPMSPINVESALSSNRFGKVGE